eukprot:Skav206617  [mRNA]  locus=scaffold1562:244648:245923:+ [translate_table: standard]
MFTHCVVGVARLEDMWSAFSVAPVATRSTTLLNLARPLLAAGIVTGTAALLGSGKAMDVDAGHQVLADGW